VFSTLVNQCLYCLAHFLGVLVLYLGLRRMLAATGQPRVHATLFSLVYLLCNFGIAKLLFDLFKSYEPFDGRKLFLLSHYFEGGFWGWMIGFLPACLLYPFLARLERLAFFRALALGLPFVIAFQKLACAVSGCCTGIACELPWCFAYPEYWDAETFGMRIHPLPLYDIGLLLVIQLALGRMDRREELRPFLLPSFFALFSLARFSTEMLRPFSLVDTGQLLASQLFELATLVAMLALLGFGRDAWRGLLGRPGTA
jgi:prolipoprotein diacylglyceryltransferase